MTIGGVQQIVHSADNVNLLFQVIEGKQDHCSFECRTAIENETIWIRINAQAYKTKGSKKVCQNSHLLFYAQSPDFHKLGLCYNLKILYL